MTAQLVEAPVEHGTAQEMDAHLHSDCRNAVALLAADVSAPFIEVPAWLWTAVA